MKYVVWLLRVILVVAEICFLVDANPIVNVEPMNSSGVVAKSDLRKDSKRWNTRDQSSCEGCNFDTQLVTAIASILFVIVVMTGLLSRISCLDCARKSNISIEDESTPASISRTYSVSDEFVTLQETSRAFKLPQAAAESPRNTVKNRYRNVLPYDHNRVKLSDECNDYINASYISGGYKDEIYIAAQGPTDETLVNFWMAVWEQKVSLIVMLTALEEKNKVKCAQYWPPYLCTFLYGDIMVDAIGEQCQGDYKTRDFLLTKNETEKRIVRQIHFINWPDFGCPDNPQDMIEFIQETRKKQVDGSGPKFVHCSAGIGRTGTFIALDLLMRQYHETGSFDIFKTVLAMRKDRFGMVQTEDQYRFIKKCMEWYTKSQCEPTNSISIDEIVGGNRLKNQF